MSEEENKKFFASGNINFEFSFLMKHSLFVVAQLGCVNKAQRYPSPQHRGNASCKLQEKQWLGALDINLEFISSLAFIFFHYRCLKNNRGVIKVCLQSFLNSIVMFNEYLLPAGCSNCIVNHELWIHILFVTALRAWFQSMKYIKKLFIKVFHCWLG